MSNVVVAVAKKEADKVLEKEVAHEPEKALEDVAETYQARAQDIDQIRHVADD